MNSPKTVEDLNQLILIGAEENQQLEYKSPQALEGEAASKEIGKDVSAMANASGGVIIYGIKEYDQKEKRHLPEKISSLDRVNFSKERLEQIINSNISPRIDGLLVIPISIEEPNKVVYVVEIPQSTTAHQNTKDCIYYKRYNTEVLRMQDYEIRDVMNRLTHPKIEIQFQLERQMRIIRSTPSFGGLYGRGQSQAANDKMLPSLTLRFWPANKGARYAKYINYFVDLPNNILDEKESYLKISETSARVRGDNTVRDIVDSKLIMNNMVDTKYGPSRYDPILPGIRGRPMTVSLDPLLVVGQQEIVWDVYADNAPINHGVVRLNEITIIEKAPQ